MCLPLVALLLAAFVQAGLIVSDQTRLWLGAREAARTAVVEPDMEAIEQAAQRSGLTPVRISVHPQPALRSQGEPLKVEVGYSPRSLIPLLGPLLANLELHASATMRIEQP